MTGMRLIALDPWADAGAGFNRSAADVVYKAMTTMDPDAALIYGRILVGDSVRYDLIAHRDELAKAAEQVISKRTRALRRHYTREAVSKARAGADNTHELTCLVHIAKAFDFTAQERRQNTAGQTRGAGGRFVQERQPIITTDSAPMDPDHAKRVGIRGGENLDGATLAAYQQAYGQIQDMLAPFHGRDLNPLLHLGIVDSVTQEPKNSITVAVNSGEPAKFSQNLEPGDRIATAAVSVTPVGVQGAAFDVMSALAGPRVGTRAGGATADLFEGVLNTDRVKQYNEARTKVDPNSNEPYSMAGRTFGRLDRGGKILQASLGPAAPPQLQYALAVANHVGQYGPEAQKVFGPSMDRAAYRYRGTEREVDPKLADALTLLRHAGVRGQRARDVAVGGLGGEKKSDGWNPGPVLDYFRGQLPDPSLNELQRRSGVIPPSEGIIIDPHRRIAHQSVGYADDWYLPFNLRHLAALKGGEYIRTRTFGGPTTEDVYTGLVSGAKALTVVSHNGVYTVDFNENLRGGRRFNDKAARMVARYGQLLDAVRSDKVSRGGVSPSRQAELAQKVRDEYGEDDGTDGFNQRLGRLMDKERRDPVLSDQESADVADQWLATATGDLGDGRDMTMPERIDSLINEKAKSDYATFKGQAAAVGQEPLVSLDDYRRQLRAKVETGTATEQIAAVAELMHQTRDFNWAMRKATEANAERIKSLKLDGQGYDAALKALKEQFPYYIDRVKYTPWRDARGILGIQSRTMEGARDTGYVIPKHNRPEQAEAGYFSEEVTGRGKVRADSTRYQNYRVKQGKIQEPAGAFASRKPSAEAAARAAAKDPKTPQGAENLQRAANQALLDELLSKQTFDPGATVAGIDVGGKNIRTYVAYPGFPHDALRQVFAVGGKAAIENMPVASAKKLLEDAANVAEQEKLLVMPKHLMDKVRNGGMLSEGIPVPSDLGAMLREHDQNHLYPNGGIAYDVKRPATPEQIKLAYDGDAAIKRLVNATPAELPPVDDASYEAHARALLTRLQASDADHTRDIRMGIRPDTARMSRDLRDADGLLRANLLRTRWLEAEANKPAVVAAPPEPDGGVKVFNLAGMTPAEQAKALGFSLPAADPNQRNVVSGNSTP